MDPESSASHACGAEEWRPIAGFEGRYEVSNLGRVRSLRRLDGGRVDRPRAEPLVMRLQRQRTGYLAVSFGSKLMLVHRLVLTAFSGSCPPGHQSAHANGQRDDNRAENLTWKTARDNAQDRVRHGTCLSGDLNPMRQHPERAARGERVKTSKLTPVLVREIRAAVAAGEPGRAIAARFGVTAPNVYAIASRRTWAHVGESP